jgi:hypothetical protein
MQIIANAIESKLYNGWLQPNTYREVVVADCSFAPSLDYCLILTGNHLEVLAPKPGKGAIETRRSV